MLKKISSLLHKNPSSKKEKTIDISWKGQAKKIDAAVHRKRALRSSAKPSNAPVKKVSHPKNNSKKRLVFKYHKVFNVDENLYVFFEKNRQFFVKSLDGKGAFKKEREISIVNNFHYDIPLGSVTDINVSRIDDQLILNYQRDTEKGKMTAFASSSDGLNYQEDYLVKNIKNRFVFARKDKHKKEFSAYTGENFIYYATSESMEKWEVRRGHLLTPRQKFFDHNGIRMVESIILKEGIFLLYESTFIKDGRIYLQLGGALFGKNNPDEMKWRSVAPIWEQSFEIDEAKEVLAIGAISQNNRIFSFFSFNGSLMTVDFPIPRFASKTEKISLVYRHLNNPILSPNPENGWESKAAFNAAAIHADGKYHLLYRAIGDDDVSVLGYASSEDGVNFIYRSEEPVYLPRERFEGVLNKKKRYKPKCSNKAVYESGGGCCGGCEDPRLTRIGKRIYLTYVAYNGHDVPGVAISSIRYDDFIKKKWKWTKARLISKPGQIQKNWLVFPEKINGKYAILHSITPKIMIDYFDNLDEEKVYIENSFRKTDTKENRWDNIVRGAGAPPIKTKYGWLLFYHAMDRNDPNRYKIGAMILDLNEPEKILYRSKTPVLEPDEVYENEGLKAGVVYVCGVVVENGMLHLYYGGADMVTCVATTNLDEFLENLVQDEKTHLQKIC